MRDFLTWLLHFVWPPRNENEAEYRWQVSMTVTVMTLTTAFSLWVMASLGSFESIPARATVSDVAALRSSQDEIKVYIIGQDIYQTRREQCAALRDSSALAKSYTVQRLNDLLIKYRRISGEDYRLPDCGEI